MEAAEGRMSTDERAKRPSLRDLFLEERTYNEYLHPVPELRWDAFLAAGVFPHFSV